MSPKAPRRLNAGRVHKASSDAKLVEPVRTIQAPELTNQLSAVKK